MSQKMAMQQGRGRGNLKKEEKVLSNSKSPGPLGNADINMDESLKKLNLYRKPIAKDGSCLFRVVSEQVYHTQAKHLQVRSECINYIFKHRSIFESFIEGSFEHHLFLLKNPKEWGGEVEISALSHLYEHEFIVYQAPSFQPQPVTCNGFTKQIHLCYLNGNHYDAVYPLSYKSNAAFMQSVLYNLLLDKVIPNIDQREMLNEESILVDDASATGWTEVKKQGKGRTHEENVDRIISTFPDAGRDKKIYWQIKRSLDPNLYRNVELEVWEDNKSEIQKYDYNLAVSIQFKPGDLCLATIQESEDVSEIVRVKIQEMTLDKCRVVSEDYKNQYYVQLDALQPILNGDASDAYKNLPGYYNKRDNERELEFQAQKRRGKSRRFRDDERKGDVGVNKGSEFGKRQDNRAERDSRRRANRKEGEKKKEAENKQALNKTKTDLKKPEKNESEKKTGHNGSSEAPVKVAQPAETAAAFWGRMRTRPAPIPSTTTDSTSKPTNVATDAADQSNHSPKLPQSKTNGLKKPTGNSDVDQDKSSTTRTDSSNGHARKQPSSDTSNDIAAHAAETNKQNVTHKPAWGTLPSPTIHSFKSNTSHDMGTTPSTTSNTYSDSENLRTSNMDSDAEKLFNLTTQARLKVNAVRENILVTSAKLSAEVNVAPSCTNMSDVNPFTPSDDVTDKINKNSHTDNTETVKQKNAIFDNSDLLNMIFPTPLHDEQMSNGDLTEKESNQIGSVDSEIFSSQDATTLHDGSCAVISSQHVPSCEENKLSSSFDTGESTFDDTAVKADDVLKVSKDKIRKKVSFGQTTEIVEKPQELFTQGVMDTDMLVAQSSEPGKIVLPPDHREKHLDEFSNVGMLPPQQQQHIIQPSFVHSGGVTYYQTAPTVPSVLPIFCNAGDQLPYPVSMSRDPEGKDLPEDMTILRHFYNLGVQWHYMLTQQPNNMHLSQPGLLPLPVQPQYSTVPMRPLVMTSEQSVRSADCYSPNSQSNDSPLIELSQTSLMQNRFQSPHQIHIPHAIQSVSFDQFEVPRLRRTPVNRTNTRFVQQRQIYNGRGIMGQGPRQRSDFIRGTNNYHG